MNKHYNNLIILCFLLLGLLLCSVDCPRKKEPCHHTITVVNNSDSVVTICEAMHNINNNYWVLIKIHDINPNDALEYSALARYQCYEDEILNAPDAHWSSVFVLSNTYEYIQTPTYDSLFIKYDVLKHIDLAELGIDSLFKTDFTVYYP